MNTRIIIADDHELFATGLANLMKGYPEFQNRGYFKNGKEVVDFLDSGQKVDLIILDLNMPVMDGVQLLGHLQRYFPKIKKLVVSMHHTASSMELCKKLGADGLIGKDSSLNLFLDAIQRIMEGESFFQDLPFIEETETAKGFYDKLMVEYHLSKREIDIIQLIINQYESGEIAEKLNLSPLTVKTHRKNIFRKLGVRNLAGLVALVKDHPEL